MPPFEKPTLTPQPLSSHRPKAILFDLDGTLTFPLLDFNAIRRDAGIAPGRPILEAMKEMTPGQWEIANAALLRHERQAAEDSTLNAGCIELLEHLRSIQMPTAIVTRNSLDSTQIVLRAHSLTFPVLVTREDPPFKPHPDPLHLALKRLRFVHSAGDAWMVGDSYHDIEAGNAAGVKTVWISHGKRRHFEAVPWRELPDLRALHSLLV